VLFSFTHVIYILVVGMKSMNLTWSLRNVSNSLTPYEKLKAGQEVFCVNRGKRFILGRPSFDLKAHTHIWESQSKLAVDVFSHNSYGKTWGLAKEFPVDRRIDPVVLAQVIKESQPKALTGGSSDYYKVKVEDPTTEGIAPYQAECNDIIEALGMNYAEGNAFKAIWRKAAARQGNGKQGTTDLYDSEKVQFFGTRLVAQSKQNKEQTSC